MSNRIEFRHLKYFNTVAKELHFRKAAEKLFITQPALSRQIKQLEEYVGAELLSRNKRTVTLTKSGEYLLSETEYLFNHLEFLRQNIQLIQNGEEGEIRIGFVGSAMQRVIPVLLKRINNESSRVHSVLTELTNQDQIDRVLHDKLDLGFIRSMRLPTGLKKMTVHEEPFCLVLPKDHPISQDNFDTVKDFQEENFILFSSQYSHGYYEKILSIFEDQGFTPKVSHESVHANSIFRLVENKLGIGIVPSSLKHGFDLKIKFIDLNKISQRTTLSAIWKEDNRNPILEKVLKMIKD
ncbi:MAG: LysR substrate-binding domain-containing protein [Balneolaceae bacterium]